MKAFSKLFNLRTAGTDLDDRSSLYIGFGDSFRSKFAFGLIIHADKSTHWALSWMTRPERTEVVVSMVFGANWRTPWPAQFAQITSTDAVNEEARVWWEAYELSRDTPKATSKPRNTL
jgi:hypothetical protein